MFITFEGIDACGKSTQIQLMAEALKAQGRDFISTKEPGGTEIGQPIRQILLDPEHENFSPQAELLLYLADRAQHLHTKIQPALALGKLVLCDRYHDATIAYQGGGRQLDLSWLKPFEKTFILKPDLTFWFDLDPELAQVRLHKRSQEEGEGLCRLEREEVEFFTRIREGYAQIAREEPDRVVTIDAAGSVEAIHVQVMETVNQKLS